MLASDGDIEEGVTSEASSLAGHQQLGNLVVLYDANHISIEDDTAVALSEDTGKRYEAYGWHVQTVDWTGGEGTAAGQDGTYAEDVPALHAALEAAQADTDRPSLVILRTVIAWPAPNLHEHRQVARLGPRRRRDRAPPRRSSGFDPDQTFQVDDDVLAHAREVVRPRPRGARGLAGAVRDLAGRPTRTAPSSTSRLSDRRLPEGWAGRAADVRGGQGRRHPQGVRRGAQRAQGRAARAVGRLGRPGREQQHHDGGRAVVPPAQYTHPGLGPGQTRTGGSLHFGIREHAMGSIMNGIALHGGTRVFGGTFLVFSDYMRPAVRLAALMKLPVTYVWTHDSIGLGEDGPTHQPIEHLAALRAIPGLDVVRPGRRQRDRLGLAHDPRPHRPARGPRACRRQNLPTFDRSAGGRLRLRRRRGQAAATCWQRGDGRRRRR